MQSVGDSGVWEMNMESRLIKTALQRLRVHELLQHIGGGWVMMQSDPMFTILF